MNSALSEELAPGTHWLDSVGPIAKDSFYLKVDCDIFPSVNCTPELLGISPRARLGWIQLFDYLQELALLRQVAAFSGPRRMLKNLNNF